MPSLFSFSFIQVFLKLSGHIHPRTMSQSRYHTRIISYIDSSSLFADLLPGSCHTMIPVPRGLRTSEENNFRIFGPELIRINSLIKTAQSTVPRNCAEHGHFFFRRQPRNFENVILVARRRDYFRVFPTTFLVAQLPPKRVVLVNKISLASCQRCRHSVEPRALKCPFKQSNLSAR